MKSYRMIYIRSYEKNVHLRKLDTKKIWWKWYQTSKYIQKVIKILLQYYCNIFKSSFGYGIFKGNIRLFYAPEFQSFFRRHKRGILCCRTSCYHSWMLYSISGISVGHFPKFLDIYRNSFIYNYIVLLPRNNHI